MAKVKTHVEESDILIIGGGMAGTGATFEARHWGRDLKIVCVEKANIDRSGAVAQGLYAITNESPITKHNLYKNHPIRRQHTQR